MTIGWKSTATVGVVVLQENPRTENKHSCYAHGRKNRQIVCLSFFLTPSCVYILKITIFWKYFFSKEHQKNESANAVPRLPKDVNQENHLGYQTIDSSVLHCTDSMSLVMGKSFKRHCNMWLMNLYIIILFSSDPMQKSSKRQRNSANSNDQEVSVPSNPRFSIFYVIRL